MHRIFSILPFRAILLVCLLLKMCLPLAGQRLSSFQNYTHLSDFPQNSIQAIHQDRQGYIWIGTESGFNRYDGRRVINYKLGANENFILRSKRINQVAEDADGNLWLATSNGGINIIAPQKSPRANQQLAKLTDSINQVMATQFAGCIKFMRTGIAVIAMDTGICVFNPGTRKITRIRNLSFEGKEYKFDIVNIEEDEKGRCILAASTGGLFVLDAGFTVRAYYEPGLFQPEAELHLIDITCTPGNLLFISSAHGVYKLYLDAATGPARLTGTATIDLSTLRVNCMIYDSLQRWILLGSNTAGVITIDSSGRVVDHLYDNKKSQKLHSNTIYSFHIDTRGSGYWVGTRAGLNKFCPAEDKFSSFQVKLDEDQSALPVYPLYTEDNEHILTGTARSLVVYNVREDEKKEISIPGGQPLRFHSIVKMADRAYLFGTRNGIYLSDNYLQPVLKKLSAAYPELAFTDKLNVLCFLPVQTDLVLIGARGDEGGLLTWNRKTHVVKQFRHNATDPVTLPDNTINYLAVAGDGKAFICTNKGIVLFDPATEKFERVLAPGVELNYPHVATVLPADSIIWIGTYGGGLNKYNKLRKTIEYITENEGLANNEIYAIQQGAPDELWLSTNKGLILYQYRDKKIRNFDKSYGLNSNEFNRTSSFRCGDTIYFGGLSGVNYFNRRNFKETLIAPGIDISSIALLDARVEKIIFPDDNKVTVSHRTNTFKFYLASPYYINADKTEFYYRILPNQPEWISNGNNNELIITQLPPGKHKLELRARSSEGVFSTETKSLTIIVTPPWYQTWWFRSLLILLVTAILFGFYKMRITQLRNENRIRNQLASDLHDDLGSTLNSVKVYSNLAMMEKENTNHLQKIKESTQDAIAGVRDLIWVLDDKRDTVGDLLSRINQFAAPLCEANHVNFVMQVDEPWSGHQLGKEEKRNLFMVLKESITNSIKYAGSDTIRLQVSGSGKKITIGIRDNGKGFDPTAVKMGNGLKNIRNRARQTGYDCEIIASPGGGTTIKLTKR